MTPGITHPNTAAPVASGDWLAHTWRLVSWNLRLARRRLMGKIVVSILVVGFLGLVGILLLGYGLTSATTTSSTTFCATPASSGQPPPGGSQPCTTTSTTSAASQGQQEIAQLLTFPDALMLAGSYLTFMGLILICILAGAQVGNEYGNGTHRLALSRGASRAQLLMAQVMAFAILALAASLGLLILGALVGVSLGPLLGGIIPAIPGGGWIEILGFWLVLAFKLFAYALIALFLATAGRSTAAGIAGSLGYYLFETVALPIIISIALAINGLQSGAAHIQDVFIGPNLNAALTGVSGSPLDLGGRNTLSSVFDTIAPFQGLVVSILYCLAFIGLSYWMMRSRDVTH
jgi:ABC-type transport system involved in multi-copper enzyme maturation permease subunit